MSYDKTELNIFAQRLYDKKMQEGKHGHYETMFHVIHRAIEWVAAKPEQQAQAGEPLQAQFHDHPDFVGGVKWSELELKWIEERDQQWRQSHREALLMWQKHCATLCCDNAEMASAIAKKDAALKAQNAALGIARQYCDAGWVEKMCDDAITQGNEALK